MSPAEDRDGAVRPEAVDWIAVDWGTSNLRAWAMDAEDRPLAEAASEAGMGGLERQAFEPALLDLIGGWLSPDRVRDVVACGMVGARQGWVEAAYASVPCPPRRDRPFARPRVSDPRIAVHVLHGLRQDGAWDVMRGEETQVAGLIAERPRFDGVVCLPGTHSKWAHVSAGEVVSFATYLTGEMFALLSGASVLRHTVGASGWSEPDFREAVAEALSHPEHVSARLFGLRAEHLLADLAPERARARLSGLLIGCELAGSQPYWLGREVVLIGADAVVSAYASALALCGLEPRAYGGAAMTRAGLAAAHHALLTERAET